MSRMRERHKQATKTTTARPNEEQRTVASVKRASTNFKGRFVTLIQTPKNTLELIPNPQAIAEFVADNRDHLPTDILLKLNDAGEENLGERRFNVWGDDATLMELLEDALSNGWSEIKPEDVGALTSAPILEAPDGRIYWHERYQVEAAAEELILGKTVKFDGAPENRQPAPEKIMPEKPAAGEPAQPKESSKKAAEGADDIVDTPEATEPPPPAAPPAPAPTANPYTDWQTTALIETIENLTDQDTFATAKPEQKAVEQMAEVLSARPVQQEEAPAKTSALKKAGFVQIATIEHKPGHKNSKGETAEWCNMKDGKVLDSHKTKDEAEKALRDHEYFKSAGVGAFPPVNADSGKVLEGDSSIPSGHEMAEDNTGITVPATDLPSKFAGAMSVNQAVKAIENLSEKLKALYLDAKPIANVNETRPVREAIESIYNAGKAMGEAQKVLLKQQKQEADEEAAQLSSKEKAKKSSSLIFNLKLASAEPEEKTEEPTEKKAHRLASSKDRNEFRSLIASNTDKLQKEAAAEIGDAIMRTASAYGTAHRACRDENKSAEEKEGFEAKKAHLQGKISSLTAQLGITASFASDVTGHSVRVSFANGQATDVPTS